MDVGGEHRAARPVRRWLVRRFVKWIGACVCVLLLLGGPAGLRWAHVRAYHPRLGVVSISGGGIQAIIGDDNAPGGIEFDLRRTDRDFVTAQWSVSETIPLPVTRWQMNCNAAKVAC